MAKNTKGKLGLIEKTKALALKRNKARLVELVALIRRRVVEVVEGFYDIGEALREMLDHKLYAAVGHKSLEALLAAEGLMTGRQARKLVAVVRKVPREQALALGQEKAYALVAYTDATPEDDSPAGLLAANAKVGAKPVTRASVREIREATRVTRAKVAASRPKSEAQRAREAADTSLLKALRALLREAGLGRAVCVLKGDDVRVTFSRAVAERATHAR